MPAPQRFRALDRYRVEREWKRYEGTAQRDLFRQLRIRFLRRHALEARTILEVGPGPGRFTPFLGPPSARRIQLDLSREMLLEARRRWSARPRGGSPPEPVLGDALKPPFRGASFDSVVALGNAVGFAEGEALRLLDRLLDLVAPGGTILMESVAGTGERARYFARLPPGAAARVLRSPLAWLLPRVEREGFDAASPPASREKRFHRLSESEIVRQFEVRGFAVREVGAVAPGLGSDPARLRAASRDPESWSGLLDLEEALGRRAERRASASALLIAATRP